MYASSFALDREMVLKLSLTHSEKKLQHENVVKKANLPKAWDSKGHLAQTVTRFGIGSPLCSRPRSFHRID
jgi:hypothetical protein